MFVLDIRNIFIPKINLFLPYSCSSAASDRHTLKPSFHISSLTIAGSLKILPAIVSDYMGTLFSDRAIVDDRERSYALVIPAIRRSWVIIWKLGFNSADKHLWNPCVVITSSLTRMRFNYPFIDFQWELRSIHSGRKQVHRTSSRSLCQNASHTVVRCYYYEGWALWLCVR